MKTCWKCQQTKLLESFALNKAKKDGRQGMCRQCKSSYDKKEYQTHKSRARNYCRKQKRRARELIAAYLMDKQCVRCGFDDPRALHFDHLDRKTKYKEVTRMLHHCDESILKEIEKCQILCANCHSIKSYEESSTTNLKHRSTAS